MQVRIEIILARESLERNPLFISIFIKYKLYHKYFFCILKTYETVKRFIGKRDFIFGRRFGFYFAGLGIKAWRITGKLEYFKYREN